MPRLTASARRARVSSIWASLLLAAARLTLSPSASPAQPSRSASAIRSVRLPRMSSSRCFWEGSTRRSEHRMQLCSWMQVLPQARPQSPRASLRRSKWPRNSSHSESVGARYSSLGRSSRRRAMNARCAADGLLGIGGLVSHGRGDAGVPHQELADVRRHPVHDRVGREDPPEIMGLEGKRLPGGVGDAGAFQRGW